MSSIKNTEHQIQIHWILPVTMMLSGIIHLITSSNNYGDQPTFGYTYIHTYLGMHGCRTQHLKPMQKYGAYHLEIA